MGLVYLESRAILNEVGLFKRTVTVTWLIGVRRDPTRVIESLRIDHVSGNDHDSVIDH